MTELGDSMATETQKMNRHEVFQCKHHVILNFFIILHSTPNQRVDTIKREMFSQKSVRRFVGDSSAFVMGAMFLASALNRGIHPPEILKNV